MSGEFSSWRATAVERKKLGFALVETAGAYFGVPVAGWFAEYLYNRRQLLFDKFGIPLKAYNYQGKGLRLSGLMRGSAAQQGQLSLNVDLTQSALQMGLRNGDPVTVVLTGHAYVRTPNGLIVPARVGEPVNLAVPQGNYNLAAFGSRRDTLFTTPDPFTALGGTSLQLNGSQQVAVPLAARQTAAPPGCDCPQCRAARNQAPTAGCNCAQCQAARNQIPAAGCNCPQCQAARNQAPVNQAPVAGCDCPQCQAARTQFPAAGCNCAQCQAARYQTAVNQAPVAGCNCPQCQAARVPGCNCAQCRGV